MEEDPISSDGKQVESSLPVTPVIEDNPITTENIENMLREVTVTGGE